MKVGIQNKESRLILVWNEGKRWTMAIGLLDTPPARALAEKTKAKIEWDWHMMLLLGGEAAGLLWQDIADDCRTVHFCRSITRGHEGRTKTKRDRKINLSPAINTQEFFQGVGSGCGDHE
jgi:hypothetical protein